MAHIVILPGWMQTSADWKPVQEKLGAHTVDIIDLPGFGVQPIIDREWGVPEYADYVASHIALHNWNDLILIGHSFGGRVASYLAAKKPLWLKALVLYGAPCLYRPTLKVKIISRLAKIAKRVGFSKKLSPNKELLAADEMGLGTTYRKTIPFDQSELVKKIQVPTLLLWGAEDTEAPTYIAEELQQLIPRNYLQILAHQGHNIHLTNPSLFYGVLTQYIKNL